MIHLLAQNNHNNLTIELKLQEVGYTSKRNNRELFITKKDLKNTVKLQNLYHKKQ